MDACGLNGSIEGDYWPEVTITFQANSDGYIYSRDAVWPDTSGGSLEQHDPATIQSLVLQSLGGIHDGS